MFIIPAAQSNCCYTRRSRATYILRKHHLPRVRSQAVVCVSTPRKYPRSGYFLVLVNLEPPCLNFTIYFPTLLQKFNDIGGFFSFFLLIFKLSSLFYLPPLYCLHYRLSFGIRPMMALTQVLFTPIYQMRIFFLKRKF